MNGMGEPQTPPASINELINEAVREIGVTYTGDTGVYLTFAVPKRDLQTRETLNDMANNVIQTIREIQDPHVTEFIRTKKGIRFA